MPTHRTLSLLRALPSHLRSWLPSLTMMLCSFLSYLDRHALAVLAPTILAETNLNAESYAKVVSFFSFAYMIGNPVWGSLLDRIGLRAGMAAAVALWSAASTMHAGMSGFAGFAAARTLLGFGEGATFPGGLRTSVDSLPPQRQARGLALSYSGGSLGAVLTPLLVVPLSLAFGWRSVFLLTGLVGLAWIGLWLSVARPPLLPDSGQRAARFHWPNPLERRFWALVASYALGAIALGPVLYLSPLYLTRVHQLSQAELGRVLWVPPLGWEIGYFFWGWIADRFATALARPARFFVPLAALSLPLALVPAVSGVPAVLALLFWSTFTAAGFIVVSLRAASADYPAGQTALVAGIAAGSWSAVVAALLPLLGRWFDAGLHARIFQLVSILPAAGVAIWSLCHLGKPDKSLQTIDRFPGD